MANAVVNVQLLLMRTDSLWLSKALQPKASNTAATGLLAYSDLRTYVVNALAAALPPHQAKHRPSSQETILSSLR